MSSAVALSVHDAATAIGCYARTGKRKELSADVYMYQLQAVGKHGYDH